MNREWLEQFLAEQAAEAGASEDMDWLGTVERVERPLPNVGPWGQGRYRVEATHSPQNDVRSLMGVGVDAWRGLGDAVERARSERPVRPGLFEDERVLDFLNRYEAGEFDSWLRPLDAPLRAGAGLVRGENPLAHAAYGSETAGQALVDKYGLPEWAGSLVDVAFPSPVGASRAVDMVPLMGFVVPRVLSRFGVGGGTTGVLKQLGYLDDAGLPTGVVGDADLPGVLSMNPDIKYRESRRSGEITLSVRDTQVMVRPSDFNVNDYGLPSVYYVDELYDVKNNDPAGLLTLGDALTRSADATGVTLQADPQAFGHMAMSTPQLETLYGKLGFVFDSGTTKSMTREPLPLDEPGRQAEMLRRSLLMEQIFETPDVWVDNPSEVIRLASQRVPSKRLLDRLGIDSSVTNSEEIASIVNELPANINLGPSQAAPGSWATPPAVVPEVQEGVSKVVNSFMGVAGAPGVDPAVLNQERQALIDWLAPRLGTSRVSGMSERDAFFVFNNMAPNLVSEYEDGSNLFFALQNEFGEDLTRVGARSARVAPTRQPEDVITYRPEDLVKKQTAWGTSSYEIPNFQGQGYARQLPGKGIPLTVDELPDEVYHVTTNAKGINDSGVIRVSRGSDQGLGGTSGTAAVSFTVSPEIAETLQRDLRMFAELKDLETPDEALEYFKNVMRREGLSDAQIDRYLIDTVGVGSPETLQRYREDKPDDSLGFVMTPAGGYAKELFRSYSNLRHYWGGPPPSIVIGHPQSPYWQTVRPEDIQIITVPKSYLPQEALIVDYDLGRNSLEEIQVFGDVRLRNTEDVSDLVDLIDNYQ